MAFKHQLGITKGQWLCAEAIRAFADLREIEKNYRTSEPYSDVYKKMILGSTYGHTRGILTACIN